MRKKILSAFGVAVMAGSLAMAPPVNAAASRASGVECNTWKSNKAPWTGYSNCTGMLPLVERQQVKIICIDPRGNQWTIYGRGAGNGKTSSAKCSDNPNVGVYKVGASVYRI